MGSKVYQDKKNTVYSILEKLNPENSYALESLSKEKTENNRSRNIYEEINAKKL